MNSEDQFKHSLDELLNSKEFPFDEASWQDASKLIEASKRKRRILPFIITALLLIPGISYLYLTNVADAKKVALPGTQQKKTEQVVQIKPETPVQAQDQQINKSSVKHTAISKPSENAVKENTAPRTKVRETNVPVAELKTPETKSPVRTDEPAENTTAKSIPSPVTIPIAIGIGSQIVPPPVTDKTKTESNNAPNETDLATNSADASSAPVTKAELQADSPLANENVSGKTESNVTIKENSSTPSVPVAVNTSSHSENTTPSIGSPSAPANETPQKKEENYEETKSDKQAPNPVHENSLGIETKTDQPKDEPKSGDVKNTDSTTTTVAKVSPDTASASPYEPPPFEKRTVVSFESGVNYLYGWQNTGGRDANGFNPVIGFNYYIPFSTKTILSAGAQYTYVDHLSYGSHVIKRTRYKMGEESDVTVITPVKLHYVYVPLRMDYILDRKNIIGVGVNVAYLVTSISEVETYFQRLNVKQNYQKKREFGYVQGFSKFDTQLTLFYRRRILKDLYTNIEAMYGLTDIKDNTFFNSNVFERNMGIKFTLVYNIFKK